VATIFNSGGGGNVTNLSNAQTGNGASTNVVNRRGDLTATRPAVVRIVTAVGATPTCTYQIEGSADGTAFYPLASFDASGAASPTGATFAITSATTTWRMVPVDIPWSFLRVTYSANTNVTSTTDVWVY
jgi:hypothetical protein